MDYSRMFTLKFSSLFFVIFLIQGQLVASEKNEQPSHLEKTILQAEFYCQSFKNKHKQASFMHSDFYRKNLLKAVQESSLSSRVKTEIQDQANQDNYCALLVTPLTFLATVCTLGHAPMNAQSHALCQRTVQHVQEKTKEKID